MAHSTATTLKLLQHFYFYFSIRSQRQTLRARQSPFVATMSKDTIAWMHENCQRPVPARMGVEESCPRHITPCSEKRVATAQSHCTSARYLATAIPIGPSALSFPVQNVLARRNSTWCPHACWSIHSPNCLSHQEICWETRGRHVRYECCVSSGLASVCCICLPSFDSVRTFFLWCLQML